MTNIIKRMNPVPDMLSGNPLHLIWSFDYENAAFTEPDAPGR